MMFYVLENGKPVKIDDMMVWGHRFKNMTERRVALTKIDGLVISTVFLGIDHNFSGHGEPILFETMVFDDNDEVTGFTKRYCTIEEAKSGHEEVVKRFLLEGKIHQVTE